MSKPKLTLLFNFYDDKATIETNTKRIIIKDDDVKVYNKKVK